ncbi:MAG: LytR/AlgR family response regulator transcription factor [Wenzhouxiangella sp.]
MSDVRVLIAEDETAQREELAERVQKLWPEARLVALCADGDAALSALERENPNVLFLDIRMPGASGLEVARAASARAHVVLTTAYEQYAIQAFEAGALDYVVKPVTSERLAASIERLRQRMAAAPPDIDALLGRLDARLQARKPERLQWITASQGDSVRLLAVEDVLFFRASEKYVRVVTAEEEALVRMSLKDLEERLDPTVFWRIHRSVVVAAAAVASINKDELGHWYAHLRQHAESLPVSDAARSRFRSM